VLLSQIAPGHCNRGPLDEADKMKRAELMLQNAARIDCRKFVRPKDIVDVRGGSFGWSLSLLDADFVVAQGNSKLNLAFVANLFNTHPALDPPEKKMVESINWADLYGDESDSREARSTCFLLFPLPNPVFIIIC
jgi:plastin-1